MVGYKNVLPCRQAGWETISRDAELMHKHGVYSLVKHGGLLPYANLPEP